MGRNLLAGIRVDAALLNTSRLLTTAWDWKPSVMVGCAMLALGYVLVVRPLSHRAWLWMLGVLVLLLSLVSPVDALGDHYLFSAHMLQHLLMVLAVPPLLLLGIPGEFSHRALAWTPVARAERVLGRPLPAWLLYISVTTVWHVPALYDTALQSEALHILEHLMFLVTATMFWWPVLHPVTGPPRLAPWASILYLFAAMAAGSVLGIIVTFAQPGLYPAYTHPVDELGILPLLRGWGLSPADDQQLGGLLMWIPGGAVYSLVTFAMLARWFSEPEEEAEISSQASETARPNLSAPRDL